MGHVLRRCAYAGALIALLPGLAAAGVTRAPADPNPGIQNYLYGVKALSPTDVWAVGYDCTAKCAGNSQTDQTLIEHWDGTAWTQVPSPDPSATLSKLSAVTATSPTDAWAVGYYCASNCLTGHEVERTLVLHWNGTAWTQVTSPNPFPDELTAVTATSPTNAWAVGYYCTTGCLGVGGTLGSLTEHWNGKAWSQVRSPNPGPKGNLQVVLFGVSATGSGDVWAVGSYCNSQCFTSAQTYRNLTEHWNGSAWSKVAAPGPHGGPILFAASADSPTDAWAVGYANLSSGASKSMTLHWNGTAWAETSSPDLAGAVLLYGVSAQSPGSVWAVGQYFRANRGGYIPLTLHWTGTTWQHVATPVPGPAPNLAGHALASVSADSASDAWAVGSYCTAHCAGNTETDGTLILHWNGTRWSVS